MGQYPDLEDFYRYEKNEHNAYALVNMWKKTIHGVMIVCGIVLYYNIFY